MNNFCLKHSQGLKALIPPRIKASAAKECLVNHQMNKDLE